MLHVALHEQAVALARSRQRMSAATAVFIGLWQRLGQLLGRESVGETDPQEQIASMMQEGSVCSTTHGVLVRTNVAGGARAVRGGE